MACGLYFLFFFVIFFLKNYPYFYLMFLLWLYLLTSPFFPLDFDYVVVWYFRSWDAWVDRKCMFMGASFVCVFFSFLLLLFSTSASLGLLVYFKVVVFWCIVGVPASLASMKIYCNWEKNNFEERPHCVFHIWVAPMLWFSSLEWVHRNYVIGWPVAALPWFF